MKRTKTSKWLDGRMNSTGQLAPSWTAYRVAEVTDDYGTKRRVRQFNRHWPADRPYEGKVAEKVALIEKFGNVNYAPRKRSK